MITQASEHECNLDGVCAGAGEDDEGVAGQLVQDMNQIHLLMLKHKFGFKQPLHQDSS